jgi:hypothetical protein
VREALRILPQSTGDYQADHAARIAALQVLLKRFPDDVFVHRQYLAAAQGPTLKDREAVIAVYRALADAHPNSALYSYLAARALIGANTKQAIPTLEEVAARLPLARLDLIDIYDSFNDIAKLREHIDAFMTACPASLDMLSLGWVRLPSDFIKANTPRLRALLQSRTDPESAHYYSSLWSLEFRVTPASEQDALRKQVVEDVKRLRSFDTGKDENLYSVLRQGYTLAGDAAGTKWATDQLRASPGHGFSVTRGEWRTANPEPAAGDPPEKRAVYAQAFLNVTEEWVRRWPRELYAWLDRVEALRAAGNVPPADVEEAADGLLAVAARTGKYPGMYLSPIGGASFTLIAANLCAERRVRGDRLPALVAQAVAEIEGDSRLVAWNFDLNPTAAAIDEPARYYARRTIVDIWLKVKDARRARQALFDLQSLVERSKPSGDAKDPKQASKQRTYMSRQVDYWARIGDVAQLEGHKTDAMTFYQNAILARTATPASGQKDELAEKARALWTEIGGTNEGWQAWFTRRDLFGVATLTASSAVFTAIEKKLPEFDLTDLEGARWRLADFKGKPTLVGIWATW